MATLHVSVCVVRSAGNQPLYAPTPLIGEALTTSSTSATTTTIAAAAPVGTYGMGNLVARLGAVDAAHYVRVGSTAAAATNSYFVPSGSVIEVAYAPGSEISARTV